MKREIKFRGFGIKEKKWLYGSLVIFQDGTTVICFKEESDKQISSPVDSISIGQYTGLKDKNGKEIYEGDIVTNGKLIYKVEYSVQNSHFRKTPIDRIEGDFDLLLDTIDWGQLGNGYYSRKDLTITGNIHQP